MSPAKSKKSSKISAKKAPNRQIAAADGKNETSTGTRYGTPLTQAGSWFGHGGLLPVETRAHLHLVRNRVGANSPPGLVISTLLEQLENRQTYVRPPWAKDRRQTLDFQIEKSLTRLGHAM
jgi:hypothetical protein